MTEILHWLFVWFSGFGVGWMASSLVHVRLLRPKNEPLPPRIRITNRNILHVRNDADDGHEPREVIHVLEDKTDEKDDDDDDGEEWKRSGRQMCD